MKYVLNLQEQVIELARLVLNLSNRIKDWLRDWSWWSLRRLTRKGT